MPEYVGNRISQIYAKAEQERFQWVQISKTQYNEAGKEGIANLANMVATKRGWKGCTFVGLDEMENDTYRLLFRKDEDEKKDS